MDIVSLECAQKDDRERIVSELIKKNYFEKNEITKHNKEHDKISAIKFSLSFYFCFWFYSKN